MPSFTYRRVIGASEDRQDPSERLYLLLTSTAQQVGSFTIPASTGSLAVTGLGFQPDVVIFTLVRRDPGLAGASHKQFGLGVSGPGGEWSYGINVRHGTAPENLVRWREDACITLIVSNKAGPPSTIVERVRATMDSFDADGFTLDVQVQGLGTTIAVGYLALQGNFKVGSAAIPTSTGTQELSGIGFAPKGVWLASAPGHLDKSIAAPVYDRYGWDICNAFASVDDAQAMWGGARRSGAPNQSQSRWEETAFLLGLSSAGATAADVRARATLDAWLPDSFRLNWTTVNGTANYRFGYLAADEGEAGSFQIRSDGVDPVDVAVASRIEPEAMISTSTGMYGISSSVIPVVPDTYMTEAHGYIGFGANEPWVAAHAGTNPYAFIGGTSMDELCSGLVQSSGGPAGGTFPTADCFIHYYDQGFSYWHDSMAGLVDTTLTGQAFDVWKTRVRIPSMNARFAQRQSSATRGLIRSSET